MPSITRDTPAISADQQALNDISRHVVEGCPDMREMAREAANGILRKHGLDSLEPDAVYWHRFDRTETSPRTFSGWEHLDPPVESLTLPQLVMRRFNANDQDSADALQAMSGFYTAGPDSEVFNETNEVRLLPGDVMGEFWALDFKTQFNDKMTAFWRNCSDDFSTLAKANFIAKAVDDRQSKTLTEVQFNTLMHAIDLDPSQPITLAMLQAPTAPPEGVRFAKLDIAGYAASDILRIVEDSGRQFLYLPGEVDAFHVFDTPDDLQWWLMTHTNEVENRARFMSHFTLSTHAETDHQTGLHHAIDLMFSHWGAGTERIVNRDNQSITGDPFAHLRNATQTRMADDAAFALHSNGELRELMWMGYLKAFAKTFGSLAALDWPIALAAVGAGLADVGLNIDQAIHGHTTAERKNGVLGAIFGSIDVLFNGLFVVQGAAGELPEIPVAEEPAVLPEAAGLPAAEEEIVSAAPAEPTVTSHPLAPFETNELLDSYALPAQAGRMRGIYASETGQTFISIEDIAYRVRYVAELKHWVIVDPENPFSFARNLPVRLNEAGQWEAMTRQGLRGGGGALGKLPSSGASVAPSTAALPTPYDMPVELREGMRYRVEAPDNKPFTGQYFSMRENDPIDRFFEIRQRLVSDVNAFYADLHLPQRPAIPTIAAEASPKVALKQLYKDAQGLVIGESHSSVGSKQFLIDNMGQFAKQNVRTLYLEHVMTDLHQADLDLFVQTGKMPKNLESYLNELDWGHLTDQSGRYTFLNLVKTAQRHRIRIRAIDCMASYRTAGVPDPADNMRLKMMNYFADTVIRADQAALRGGKWIALVGNAHVNTMKGATGLSELEGVIGLRIEDVSVSETTGYGIDPGAEVTDVMGQPAGTVKSDIRLRMAVPGRRAVSLTPPPSLESRLPKTGNFIVQRAGDAPELIHRSRNGTLVHTPIIVEGTEVYIQRAEWPVLSRRRFQSFDELAKALALMGLKQVA
ncbi:membrane-targeted effector domain-containing toxin [Pseudomonas sp. RC10]|uniref:membrane-targeted effector domain-containing toxin n=1 Tax=Pseudomonas bambusae TaxID=3139142 RepID=UPI003138EE26